MPKPSGRIRRGVKVVGRGFAKAGKAVVHGTKVAMGRQLSRKALKRLKHSGYTAERGPSIAGVPHWGILKNDKLVTSGRTIHVLRRRYEARFPEHNPIVEQEGRKYTADGRLTERSRWSRNRGGKLVEYNPSGRFIGKRVKPKE